MTDCNCKVCIPAKWRGLASKPINVKLTFADGWVVTKGCTAMWSSVPGLVGTPVNFYGPDLLGLGTMVLHDVQTLRVLDGRATKGKQGAPE